MEKYPGSRSFKWGLARAYEEIDPATAIKLYYEVLNSYPIREHPNHINEITLKHLIAQQYVDLGEKDTALKICEEILSIKNLSNRAISILESRLERIEELKTRLETNN